MTQPHIGFIGLGLMGGAMVSRLQDQGYAVTVLGNRDRTEIDKAIARGATEATSARNVAETCDIVMLCMGTSEHVEGRMRGGDGVIAGMKPDQIVIDFGTSLPGSTRILGEEVAAAGGIYLDAPIGRTPTQALDGKLNLMCSGDKTAFDKVLPVLNDLGENIFHLGQLGNGHAMKLINNFFGQTMGAALAEAYTMADTIGIERQQMFDVLFAGPLGSPFMALWSAYPLEGNPNNLAFSIQNAAKDVGYYDQMARDAGTPSIMVGGALAALRGAADSGRGDAMVPELLDYFAEQFKQD